MDSSLFLQPNQMIFLFCFVLSLRFYEGPKWRRQSASTTASTPRPAAIPVWLPPSAIKPAPWHRIDLNEPGTPAKWFPKPRSIAARSGRRRSNSDWCDYRVLHIKTNRLDRRGFWSRRAHMAKSTQYRKHMSKTDPNPNPNPYTRPQTPDPFLL